MDLVDVFHGEVTESGMGLNALGKTQGATVPEAATELSIESITRITAFDQGSHFTAIMRMTNTRQSPTVLIGTTMERHLLFSANLFKRHAIHGFLAEKVIFPSQLLKGSCRLIDMTPTPAVGGFTGNGIRF